MEKKCQSCENIFAVSRSNRKYCQKCSGDKTKYNKVYKDNNLEKVKESQTLYQKSEKGKLNSSRYEKSIKGKKNALKKVKKYVSTKKGKLNHIKAQLSYRANKKNIMHMFTMSEWIKMKIKTNGICPKCGVNVSLEKLTLDHIYPVSRAELGRIYTINDIQPLYLSCNSSKGDKVA